MNHNPYFTTENETSQKPAIELLVELGYKYIKPEDAEKMRERLDRVVLKDILKSQLNKLNSFEYKGEWHKFSDKNINQAMLDLDEPLIDGLIKTNEKIYDHLIVGKSFEETLNDTSKKSFSLKYIDWDNVWNNEFHVTEEYSIERLDGTTRRPDIVLFVNGIPFAVIECKKTAISIKEGISQTIRNQGKDEVPNLFKFSQILLSANKNEVKYATTGTAEKFWAVWKEEDNELLEKILKKIVKGRLVTEQDKALYSLLRPERLLELTQYYTVYDKNVKKIARYQQYFSIIHTLERIKTFDDDNRRKGGLIWHTQGSGKSLTMVMLSKAIMTEKTILNPKVVVVTDRLNLDKQIKNTFVHTGMSPVRASTGLHLARVLKENKANIITTVINKFDALLNQNSEVYNDNNIFVLVDESHRTQYGELHIKMKKVFQNACYIGFTGTPLMRREKNSLDKFGGLIHKYSIDEAVKDKAVLPLLYEGKMIEQTVNKKAIDAKLDVITKHLNDRQKDEVKKKWSQFEKVASSVSRLEMIAFDIFEHFSYNWKNTPFKAMLACNSKSEAIKYKIAFDELEDIKTEVIISAPDDREGYDELDKASKDIVKKFWIEMMDVYGNAEDYEDGIKDDFINGDEIDILIVVDKLLTGFDAPKATILYIDKPLKDHGLLQAIARVNRLYEGKEFGYVIDYRGLLGNLDKALNEYSEAGLDAFDQQDIGCALTDVKKIVNELKTNYSQLIDLFKTIKKNNELEEYEVLLADDKTRDCFYEILAKFGSNLALAVSSEKIYIEAGDAQIQKYKKELKFFQELRRNVKIRYSDSIDHKEYEAKLQKLLDNFVYAGETIRITNPVDIFDEDKFSEEITRIKGKRATADAIRTRIAKTISEKFDENPAFYKIFSDMIEKVIQDYSAQRISEAEYLNKMKDILDTFKKGDTGENCPQILKNNENARALYGITLEIMKDLNNKSNLDSKEKVIAELSIKFDEVIQKRIKVDWQQNHEVHKQIALDIDDLLYKFEDDTGIKLTSDQMDKIIENIKTIALRRYRV